MTKKSEDNVEYIQEEDFVGHLQEGDSVSIGLDIEGALPLIRISLTDKKKNTQIFEFQPLPEINPNLEFMTFKVGERKKQSKVPYEVDSFEIGFPGLKAKFRKKHRILKIFPIV